MENMRNMMIYMIFKSEVAVQDIYFAVAILLLRLVDWWFNLNLRH